MSDMADILAFILALLSIHSCLVLGDEEIRASGY